MQGAVFKGGGDYPGNEFIIGSGPQALLVRYAAGRRKLDPQDQLTLEFAGVYRHYHACLMRTIVIGTAPQRQKEMPVSTTRKTVRVVAMEIDHGRFEREVAIPPDYDLERITTEWENGLLWIFLPRIAHA